MHIMTAAHFSGKVGFQLLAQPTEITVRLFIILQAMAYLIVTLVLAA